MERKVRVQSDGGKSWVSTIGLIVLVMGFVFVAALGTADTVPMAAPGVFIFGLGGLIVLAGILQSKFINACRGITLPLITLLIWAGYLWVRIKFSPVEFLAELDLFLLAGAFLAMAVGVLHPDKVLVGKIFTTGLILGVFLNGWAAFMQFKAGESISPLESLGLSVIHSSVRCTGFFYHANPFGCFSALAALWLVFSTLNPAFGKLLRILCIAGFCVAVFCVWASLSRAAFGATVVGLCAGAGLMFFGWMRGREKWTGKIALAISLTLMVTIVIAGGILAGKGMLDRRGFESKEYEKVTAVSGREIPWITSMEMFLSAPVLGHGSRGFYRNENTYMSKEWHGGAPNFDHPHNEFLEQLTDYGLLGLVLGTVALLCCLFGAIGLAVSSERLRLSKSRNPWRSRVGIMALPTSAGALAVWIAVMVDGFYSFNMHFVPNVFVAGGVTGIMLGVKNRVVVFHDGYSKSQRDTKPGSVAIVALSALVAGSLVFGATAMSTGARYALVWWPIQMAKQDYEKGAISEQALLEVMIQKAEKIDRYPFLHQSGLRCRSMAENHEGYSDDERMALMRISANHLIRACELASFDVELHRDCAITLLRLGRFEEAESYQQTALELGWNREYHYNNSFILARIQYLRAVNAIRKVDHAEASLSLRNALNTLERGMPRMRGEYRERNQKLKKAINQEIAFLKRTESWVGASDESSNEE